MSGAFANGGRPAHRPLQGCCILPQDPRVLVRAQEKGRPLNYLHDSIYEAEVLPAFQSAVLLCICGEAPLKGVLGWSPRS